MGHLEIDHLTKRYDGEEAILAVDDLSVTIEDGEFLVLVGPSGCGKSTTLRCVAGLEPVTAGDVRLDGTSIVGTKPRDRNMAMVFQNYALYPHMTARQNMGFGLKMGTDASPAAIDDRVEAAAATMGIEDLLEKRPGELSGGQQQRVALGRAIVRDPDVFLMDEPLSNLDASLRTTMRTELQELQNELGVTTLYVTHDQTEAMTMGDRVAILDGGELQQIGTPLECYQHPANRFVAGFVGSPSMNFLEGRVECGDDGPTLVADGVRYPLPERLHRSVEHHDTITVGVRPEHVAVSSNTRDGVSTDRTGTVPSNPSGTIQAEVSVVEPLGNVTYAYLSLGGIECTASVDPDLDLAAGDTVAVTFRDDRIVTFDADSGETLTPSAQGSAE